MAIGIEKEELNKVSIIVFVCNRLRFYVIKDYLAILGVSTK